MDGVMSWRCRPDGEGSQTSTDDSVTGPSFTAADSSDRWKPHRDTYGTSGISGSDAVAGTR